MYAVLLGILQGITEFLPVSSSGHLVLAQSLLPGFQEPAALFDAILHGGTLVAVLVYFRTDVTALLSCLRRGGDPGHRRLLLWLVAGTVPTGVVGVLFKGPLEALFEAPRFAAAMLLVTHNPLGLIVSTGMKVYGEETGSSKVEGRAKATAKEIGVDELTWHLNIAQDQESSPRYHVGSEHLVEIKDELWDTILARRGVNLDYDLGTYR